MGRFRGTAGSKGNDLKLHSLMLSEPSELAFIVRKTVFRSSLLLFLLDIL